MAKTRTTSPWRAQLQRLDLAFASRASLAAELGTSEAALTRWLAGKERPRPDTQVAIGELFARLSGEATVGLEALITAHQAVEAVLTAPTVEDARLRARRAKEVLHAMLARVHPAPRPTPTLR